MSQVEFSPICVSLDGHTVRAVQLKSGDPAPVQAYAYTPYLSGNPDELDLTQQLHSLENVLAEPHWGDFVGNRVLITLPSLSENERVRTLSFTNHDELSQQLQAENFGSNEPQYFTHMPIHQYVDPSGQLQQVMLVRSQPAVLHHYLDDVLNELPFEAELVSATAGLGGLLLNDGLGPAIALQLGVQSTKIVVVNNQILAVQTMPYGFEQILHRVSEDLGTERKHAYKILTENLDPNSKTGKVVGKSLDASTQVLAQAIKDIAATSNLTKPKLVILGDGSRVHNLAKYLASKTNTEPELFDPWAQVARYPLRPMPNRLKPTFSLPLAMALGSIAD